MPWTPGASATSSPSAELSKNIRGQDNDLGIAEEIADVEIMLEQLKVIFDIRTDVETVKQEKLIRLDRRTQEATKGM